MEDNSDWQLTLASIADEFGQKAESCAKLTQELKAEEKAIREESARLEERARTVHNNLESLKSYILREMQAIGKDSIRGKLLKISIQDSPPSVEILDMALVPNNFIRTNPTVDKKAVLLEWENSHGTVLGTQIVTGKKHLVIR